MYSYECEYVYLPNTSFRVLAPHRSDVLVEDLTYVLFVQDWSSFWERLLLSAHLTPGTRKLSFYI